jgi:hypothetical protein
MACSNHVYLTKMNIISHYHSTTANTATANDKQSILHCCDSVTTQKASSSPENPKKRIKVKACLFSNLKSCTFRGVDFVSPSSLLLSSRQTTKDGAALDVSILHDWRTIVVFSKVINGIHVDCIHSILVSTPFLNR